MTKQDYESFVLKLRAGDDVGILIRGRIKPAKVGRVTRYQMYATCMGHEYVFHREAEKCGESAKSWMPGKLVPFDQN